jgi:secreted repeat protein with Y-X4-D motif
VPAQARVRHQLAYKFVPEDNRARSAPTAPHRNGASASIKPKTSAGSAATLGVADNSNLGKILVDSQGRTLYLFQMDTNGSSACLGACAVAWPPLLVTGKPAVGAGLTASKVGTAPTRALPVGTNAQQLANPNTSNRR